jgi:AcrR family transcriptional regulator
MSPKPDVSETRKKQIIEAATNVFSRMGFHKARMDDIVEESGLSKGTLYWYFKSKDDIIKTILDGVINQELAHVRDAMETTPSAKEKLRLFTQITIDDTVKMQPLMPILYEFFALATRKNSIRRVIVNYYQSFIDMIEPIIELGIQQGEFRQVDVENTAIAIGALFEGTILLGFMGVQPMNMNKQIESGMQLLVEGLQV